MNVLEITHSELKFEEKFCSFLMEIKIVIVLWIFRNVVPEIRNPIMCQWTGVKMEV